MVGSDQSQSQSHPRHYRPRLDALRQGGYVGTRREDRRTRRAAAARPCRPRSRRRQGPRDPRLLLPHPLRDQARRRHRRPRRHPQAQRPQSGRGFVDSGNILEAVNPAPPCVHGFPRKRAVNAWPRSCAAFSTRARVSRSRSSEKALVRASRFARTRCSTISIGSGSRFARTSLIDRQPIAISTSSNWWNFVGSA